MTKQILFSISTFFLCAQTLLAQTASQQIHLWENGAPGFENKKDEPETAQDWWIRNIHNPSITVFLPPKDKATGAAVLVCPGGGFRSLVYNSEGRDAALYLNSIGVAAFVLKYRLFRTDSIYTIKNVKQDAQRAMRLVRSRAQEFQIDTARLGIMGFSAGGEVVATVAYDNGIGNKNAQDFIERFNCKPNFQILIYPGPLGIPDSVASDAPPAFLMAANNDECCSEPIVSLLKSYRKAKVSVEAHIFAMDKHGFNMGNRSKFNSIKTWAQRLTDWLNDTGWLVKIKN